MHILVINDDGPPSQQSSPYVHSLVDTLQKAGHEISICLPDTQKSWIGKAHLVGQTLQPTYFRPGALHTDDGTVHVRPSKDGFEDWILVNGTPASCVQVGLHHFFKDKPPIDLVLSGPNYGRNTTALFSLSSGTIGGAMEGAVCGKKAIALSYAFDSRIHDPEVIKAASEKSTKLIEHLCQNWPKEVDLYSVNVPLREGVQNAKILYTSVLQNKWSEGSSYEEIVVNDEYDPIEQEHLIREQLETGSSTQPSSGKVVHRHFRWAPKFKDVYNSVELGGEGSDGWVVKEGLISVTPLKANFWHVSNITGEIKFSNGTATIPNIPLNPPIKVSAIIDYPDAYVQPLLLAAVKKHLQDIELDFLSPQTALSSATNTLQLTSYENLNFEHALSHPSSSIVNSYIIRKALIRKHYLSSSVATWIVKNPNSFLKQHFKPALDFELDYSAFLDEALVEAYELQETFQRNASKEYKSKEWWILKPGMSDGGNGIRLFSSFEELHAIFQDWDESESEDEDEGAGVEDEHVVADKTLREDDSHAAMTSQLRHFIAQPYIDRPLLLPSKGFRKFHIRVYVLAIGALKVYVYQEMLALFAARKYTAPGASGSDIDLGSHLTNTCFQDESTRESSVFRFWSLEDNRAQDPKWKSRIYDQICRVTGEVFEAAARGQMIHFQTLPNAFELFGVDFLVDDSLIVWLLELNAFPDFKQTGNDLQDLVVGGLFDETIRLAVRPFFTGEEVEANDRMELVKNIDLGRR